MTTPAPPLTTGSFQRVLWPHDIAAIVNLLVGGSPFANTLTRYPTARAEVAFPTAKPDRPAWVAEGADLPVVGLGDDAELIGLCKLAEVLLLSNESISDTSVNLTQQVGELLRDSASAALDHGLLYGEGAPEPAGVVATAPEASGEDLAAALTAAIGSIGDAGGTATHLAARPSVLANARNLRDNEGRMQYPAGLGEAFGVAEVGVPELRPADILCLDSARVFLVLRSDFTLETSQDYAFRQDAAALRVQGRFAVAAPALDKAIRKLAVADDGRARSGKASGKAA